MAALQVYWKKDTSNNAECLLKQKKSLHFTFFPKFTLKHESVCTLSPTFSFSWSILWLKLNLGCTYFLQFLYRLKQDIKQNTASVKTVALGYFCYDWLYSESHMEQQLNNEQHAHRTVFGGLF